MISDFKLKNTKELKTNAGSCLNKQTFGCFIIGESTLPIKCGEMLLNHGHKIYGVISNDPDVTQWSRAKNIPCIKVRKSEIFPFLSSQSFDYLLSINGDYVMPEEVLALPDQLAINYHDSPLPEYAGMYATSWALMNREPIHAVTWHVADKEIDTGDILKQFRVPIEPGDTAFTLNLRCYEAALNAFEELIGELTSGQVKKRKQDLNKRTYFGYYKRPASACVFSFNNNASKIDAFIRALDFGSYNNPLGMPKIMVGKDFFIIPGISVSDSCSGLTAGTVVHIGGSTITISTLTKDIEIKKIYSLEGKTINVPDFAKKCNLYEGYKISAVDEDAANYIDEYNSIICKHEKFWVNRISRLQPLELPVPPGAPLNPGSRKQSRIKFSIPGNANPLTGEFSWAGFLITVFSIYLSRLNNLFSFDIGYTPYSHQKEIKRMKGIFAETVPMHIELDSLNTFKELATNTEKELNLIHKRKTYIKDILMRYPVLKSSRDKLGKILSAAVTLADSPGDFEPPINGVINLVIPGNGKECFLLNRHSLPGGNSIIKDFKKIVSVVAENENIKLQDIKIPGDLKYSESDIFPGDLDDFGF